MKKTLLFFLLFAGFVFSMPQATKAISYRGFVEASYVNGFDNKYYSRDRHQYENKYFKGVNANTTHGVQVLKNLFVGAGVGYVFTAYEMFHFQYRHLLSFYGDVRWDGFGLFGLGKRVSPFVDLKIGYQIMLTGTLSWVENNGYYYSIYRGNMTIFDNYPNHIYSKAMKPGGLFIRPTIGVRIGLSKKVGFNIGIFCDIANSIRIKSFEYTARHDNFETGEYQYKNMTFKGKTFNYFPFGLTLGVDF